MNLVALLFGLFWRNPTTAQPQERVPYPEDGLSGMLMDYLIGNSNPQIGKSDRVTVVGYDIDFLPRYGIGAGYCNLFEEAGRTGKYGPYLDSSDTAHEYGEGQIDPEGSGWMLNLSSQFRRRQKSGFKYVELDNPDAYRTKYVNSAVSMASEYGLRVLAKNPGICENPVSYVSHQNIYGIIVERGAGTPSTMDALRTLAGRPELPVWFVFFGSGKKVAEETARLAKRYVNMSVTYSSLGEYGSSEDVVA